MFGTFASRKRSVRETAVSSRHSIETFKPIYKTANKAREVSLTSLPLAAGVVAKLGFANHVVEQGEAWKKAKEIAENIMKNEQGFSDLEDVWDDLPVSRLKYNALDDFQEVFQTTFKSSGLPGSRLTKSSPMSLPFITDLSVLVFNQMVLIFHSFKGFSDLENLWDELLFSRLKYNALDDFQEVFQTKSGSRLDVLEAF
ncbi:hypothetical protein YC2023_099742 [Brassica napus]